MSRNDLSRDGSSQEESSRQESSRHESGPAQFSVRADDPHQRLEDLWPPFGLRIESPRLVLRQIRESDFPAYTAAITSGVTQTARNPFVTAWNEGEPEDLVRTALPWLWSQRATAGSEDWYLMLAVFLRDEDDADDGGSAGSREGQLIGMQDVHANSWTVLRTVGSGSWLRADRQGHGYGTEMRAAMLAWAFDHFGAQYAESAAFEWNARSLRVSASLGYREVGRRRTVDAHGEHAQEEVQLRLARREFVRPSWPTRVLGSERLQSFFCQGPL